MQDEPNQSALELRLKQITKYMTLAVLAILALCFLLFMYVGSVKQSESVAQQNQQTQAKLTIDSDVCKVYPDQELCQLARTIAANPKDAVIPKDGLNGKDGSNGTNGTNGSNGVDGRGVSKFDQTSGNLIVTYTDGQSQDLGRVLGKDGSNGKDGTNGTNGKDGATGETGAAGRGIIAANVVSGSLIISYSDGTTQDAGLVVGPKGDPGETGATGPAGAPGAPGANGLTVTSVNTDAAGWVTLTYSDNTQVRAGQVIIPSIETFDCTNGVLTLKLTNQQARTVAADCSPDNAPSVPGLGK